MHALEVTSASADVLYTTLAGGTFNANALRCTLPMAVNVRNSILVTRGGTPPDEVACHRSRRDHRVQRDRGQRLRAPATRPWVPSPAGAPQDWFANFTGGDFHLQNDGVTDFADIAQWETGDPAQDIDGDLRPSVDGTADVAGSRRAVRKGWLHVIVVAAPLGCGDDLQAAGDESTTTTTTVNSTQGPGSTGMPTTDTEPTTTEGPTTQTGTETDTETTGSIPCDDDDDCMTPDAPFCGPAGGMYRLRRHERP